MPDRLPFPDEALDMADGRVVLRASLPRAQTPWPTPTPDRTGFSVVQSVVVPLEASVDEASLPGWGDMARDGSVRLVDLGSGERWPVMAELDAAPQDAPPAMIVRPLRPLPDGARVAVVLTSEVRTPSGEPLRFDWFDQVIDGVSAGGDDALGQAWRDRVETLGGLGEDDVTLAVSFPVQADTEPLRALMRAREQPSAWSWDRVIDEDLPPRTYKQLQGTFTVPYWLADGQIGWEGAAPMQAGVAEASLFVHLPASVEGLEGTAPIWVFGHGIFGNPGIYLQDDDDPSAMLALADRAGAVVVATTWRGLTTRDFAVPLGVAQDIATFGVLRDHLMQGLFNTASLVDLLRDGALADDPAWEGVADPQTLRYHGISLGGIEGAVLQAALGEDAMPSVLHVGGGMWSTMLERSTHWTLFEDTLVDSGMVDATDRQLAYAATQLWWDPVDPAVWGPALRGLPLLWQISAGDEQVPNVASWVVARGAQAQQVGPSAVPVPGVLTADAPSTGPALSVFDPGFGSSDDTNRPAEETDAHETPRRWEGAIQQSLVFLDAQDPGVAVAPCGDAPCTSERTGP